jgi:hypothetical protein
MPSLTVCLYRIRTKKGIERVIFAGTSKYNVRVHTEMMGNLLLYQARLV